MYKIICSLILILLVVPSLPARGRNLNSVPKQLSLYYG